MSAAKFSSYRSGPKLSIPLLMMALYLFGIYYFDLAAYLIVLVLSPLLQLVQRTFQNYHMHPDQLEIKKPAERKKIPWSKVKRIEERKEHPLKQWLLAYPPKTLLVCYQPFEEQRLYPSDAAALREALENQRRNARERRAS